MDAKIFSRPGLRFFEFGYKSLTSNIIRVQINAIIYNSNS